MFTISADHLTLLSMARQTLTAVCSGGQPPEFDPAGLPAALTEKRACFVTLTNAGKLRGCIGTVEATEPLYLCVVRNAQGAALRDPRFTPVLAPEVPSLRIEISVLTELAPLRWSTPAELLDVLRPGIDGVVLRRDGRMATFLPQVWEHVGDKERFLTLLCEKAGCDPGVWRDAETGILTYQVESFCD